jgi:hypothetical protein
LDLAPEVYSFWSLGKAQQQGSDDIFQPNIVKVRGNIFSTTNPDEEVLGIFSVSGTASARIEIKYGDYPVRAFYPPAVTEDCRAYSGGSTEIPPFY